MIISKNNSNSKNFPCDFSKSYNQCLYSVDSNSRNFSPSPNSHNSSFDHSSEIVTSDVSEKIGAVANSGKLGSITKSQSKNKNNLSNAQSNRRSAYALKNTSAKLLPAERVGTCLNCRVTADRGVDVKLNKANGRATYGNLMRCNSVWVCPCCSARILAQRGKEVEKGVETWTEAGGSVFMLTLTHSHARTDNLAKKMKLLQKALSRFFGDRAMKAVFNQVGKVGQIKALETTYSPNNGWHPHHHILMFSKLSPEQFEEEIVSVTFDKNGYVQYVSPEREEKLIVKGRIDDIQHVTFEFFIKNYWVKICKAVDLGLPSIKNGATIQNASAVKTYLTKFKTAQELTNAQAKKGKNGSRNQWEILADAHKKDFYLKELNFDDYCGGGHLDAKTKYEYRQELKKAVESERLWQEYAKCFKGQRQLFWSRGLKELLSIDEIDDNEINEFGEVSEEEIINVIELNLEIWGYIRRKNWQPHLLDVIENDFKDETNYLEIFIYSIQKLIEIEKEEEYKREQERIKNELPPIWWGEMAEIG